MNEMWQKIKRNRLATVGAVILILFYSAALFANFVAPYSAGTEFRNYFYHPPTVIHFRNDAGQFVAPYVEQTYIVDTRKHVFKEGIPIRIGRILPKQNKSPYIAESIEEEEPFAIVKSETGKVLGTVVSAKESAENSGFFAGQTTLDDFSTSKSLVIESRGNRSVFLFRENGYVAASPNPEIFLLNNEGEAVMAYKPTVEQFKIRWFNRGAEYNFLGLLSSDIHLLGVESGGHLFLMGTDQAGRDIFSRILHGSRISLTVGLIGVLISTCLGLCIGAMAGYFGGKTDTLLMRSADVLLSIPALYLILSVRNVFPTSLPSEATYTIVIIVLSLTGWATMARVIRGMVLSLKEQEFVLAARALGASSSRIIIAHILPNTFGYVIARATLLIPAYILAEVTLSYLGIGIQEPAASWGNMLSAAQELRVLEQFSWILSPGIFLFLTVLGFNFLGDGLTDAFGARHDTHP